MISSSSVAALPIFRRRHADMLFEVFAQEALVGEVEVVSDLLDALRCVFQQVAELQRHVGVDPLVGCLVADLLDDLGEILRGDAQLQGARVG